MDEKRARWVGSQLRQRLPTAAAVRTINANPTA